MLSSLCTLNSLLVNSFIPKTSNTIYMLKILHICNEFPPGLATGTSNSASPKLNESKQFPILCFYRSKQHYDTPKSKM
jgi:hypothetical protein